MANSKEYRFDEKIGVGAFSQVFSATKIKTQERVAIKIEDIDIRVPQLEHEAKLYDYFHSDSSEPAIGIPTTIEFSSNSKYRMLAMDLLGPSLVDLFKMSDHQFSLKTVLMIADQLITRVEFIHNKGFLHRDIKPDNFAIGTGNQRNIIHMIDFGLSKRFMKDGRHADYVDGKTLVGTVRYSSINTHKGIEQSRRDDLETLGYVLIYFLRGNLPWQSIYAQKKQDRINKVGDVKERTTIADLCEGLPKEFYRYMAYVRGLGYDEKPDYQKLKSLFKSLFMEKNYVEDFEFDWVIKEREGKLKSLIRKTAPLELKRLNCFEISISLEESKVQKSASTGMKSDGTKKARSNESVKVWSIFRCFL